MRTKTFFTMAAVALFSTMTIAQSVSYDFDRSANFSSFKTYAWTRGNPVGDELNHQRIVRAIDGQLAAKGMMRVESNGRPDVLVAYHASFDRDLQINTFGVGWGPIAGRSGTARVEEVTVGTLAVEVIDAATRSIVWRAMATKDLNTNAKPEKRDKNISTTAEKLFRNYPPKP
jgi:uncharacterized protein DUF4136